MGEREREREIHLCVILISIIHLKKLFIIVVLKLEKCGEEFIEECLTLKKEFEEIRFPFSWNILIARTMLSAFLIS